jgi:hypothetical protein
MVGIDLQALEADLRHALAAHYERRSRRRRRILASVAAGLAALALCTVALAGAIGGDIQLDPTKWSILGGGSVDGGRGAYVHATRKSDGLNATLLVEHDEGLPTYERFLLHERTLAAAQASSSISVRVEPGPLCAAPELTRAEVVAMDLLRSEFAPGTGADATKTKVEAAIRDQFADSACRGLEYAGEQARLVYAGVEPDSNLMPGARR